MRYQPLLVPLLDQPTQPRLRDRGVVNGLTAGVRAQHPEPPHVPLELSLRVGQQPLDRHAQPPVKHSHHPTSQRVALQQRLARRRARARRPATAAGASPPRHSRHQARSAGRRRESPAAAARKTGQIDLDPTICCARAAQRDGRELREVGPAEPDPVRAARDAQPRVVEGRPPLAASTASVRRARHRRCHVLLDGLLAHPAAGVAAQTEPVAPGGRALVLGCAAHDAQALLAAPGQREHARDRHELVEGAIKTPEALATAVTQRARHNRRHAARDRTQLISEHRMISRRANHVQARVVARLDQPRQIDRPSQHRQLIITRRRNAERNDRGKLSARHL